MKAASQRHFGLLFGCIVAVVLASLGLVLAGTDIKIDPDPTVVIQNETSITLLPATAGAVVTAYNDDPWGVGGLGLGVSYSTDSGATWNALQLTLPLNPYNPPPATFARAFDPMVAADTSTPVDYVFAGYIADENYAGSASGVFVHRSINGGATWSTPATVSIDPQASSNPDPNYRFNDKCHMSVDTWATSPYTNNLYVTWIKDRGYNVGGFGDIYFSVSTNQGSTFSTPATINDSPGTDMANGPNVTTGSNGTIYVAWLDVDVTLPTDPRPGTLYIDKSTNGGNTWGTDVAVRQVYANHTLNTANGTSDATSRSYPVVKVAPSNPNEVYMVYPADPDYIGPGNNGLDESDIFFIKSVDGGATWSTPLRVNHDDTTVNDNFQPWMDVKPNGAIDVAWYDRRLDTGANGDRYWDVFIARSTNGGSAFGSYLCVTDQSFLTPLGGSWMGEYLGLAADSTQAYVAFTSSISDVNGDVYFDRISNTGIPPVMGLATDYGGLGLRQYNGSTWSQLGTADSEWLCPYSGKLVVDYGSTCGLYEYDGASWTRLGTADPDNTGNTMVAYNNGIVVDYGSAYGLWYYNGSTWSQLGTADPEWLCTYGGKLVVDYGSAYGLYEYDGASWTRLGTADPDNTDNTMVAYSNGIVVDYGSAYGLWYYNGSTWSHLGTADPEWLCPYSGKLVVDYGSAYGLKQYDGSSWTRLGTADPDNGGNTMVDMDM